MNLPHRWERKGNVLSLDVGHEAVCIVTSYGMKGDHKTNWRKRSEGLRKFWKTACQKEHHQIGLLSGLWTLKSFLRLLGWQIPESQGQSNNVCHQLFSLSDHYSG